MPIVGMGGVQRGRDAVDLLRAGATLVAVGTESFRDPLAGARIAGELADASPRPSERPRRRVERIRSYRNREKSCKALVTVFVSCNHSTSG